MTKVSIKFTFTPKCNYANVFNQPLFYLSENIKQQMLEKIKSDIVIPDRIDKNLEININDDSKIINLQMLPIMHDLMDKIINGKIDSKYSLPYLLDRLFLNNKIIFKYKNVNFMLEVTEISSINPIPDGRHSDFTLYSSYQISFDNAEFEIFEDFIKTSIKYNDNYYNKINNDENKISMYISSAEGGFFEFLGKREKRKIESVYIPSKKKSDIMEDLEKFLKPETKARYNTLGINYKRTYLLEGLPGSGKTSLILALASHFGQNIAIVNFSPKLNDIELIRMLRSLDDRELDSNKKTFVVFEDIDCIFKERKSNDEARNSITFSGLLNALDGIGTRDNMITFITTNYKNNLDNALIRPGRIDYIMTFEAANKEQIMDMYKAFTCSDSIEQCKQFYKQISSINITNITTSLLQQYLMKYIDEPIKAIENVDEIKKIYESCKVTSEAGETGLFS